MRLQKGGDQRHFRLLMLRNAGRGMKRDGVPNGVDGSLIDVVLPQKIARGVRAVDFEAFRGATIGLGQAHVMVRAAPWSSSNNARQRSMPAVTPAEV